MSDLASIPERQRLATLGDLRILDTPPEAAFDDLVAAATVLTDAPICLLGLLDEHRQWFKARRGLALTELPRTHALCTHLLASADGRLVVSDLAGDPRFGRHPLVQDGLRIRSYAGVAIRVPGCPLPVGSLCVMDIAPRRLDDAQVSGLEALARLAAHQLTARRTIVGLERGKVERDDAEASLRLSEQRYEALTRVVPVGIFRCDAQGACVYVNQRWCEIAGSDLASAHGQGWIASVHPEDRERVMTAWNQAVGGQQRFSAEYRFLRPDGLVTWVIGQGAPETTSLGAVAGYVGTITDISDRKLAERALHDNEERSRAIIAALEEGIIVQAQDGSVRMVNASAERILGMPQEQILNPSSLDQYRQTVREDGTVFPPDRHPAMVALRTGQAQSNVVMGILRGGEGRVWISINAQPLIDPVSQRITGVVTSFFDITERKYLEEQLRQTQKMEAIGRLAGGVAHDFNNLLTVIKGHSGLLLDQSDTTEAVRKNAEPILRAAKRAETLTRQLLDFSRQSIIKHETLNLAQLVADEGAMLRRLISENIELTISASPEPSFIKADAGQMHQVIMNLAVNARDAMPHGGRLAISTANVRLDEVAVRQLGVLKAGHYVRLTVQDSGTGIEERILPRIFEPFFTTKDKGKGTGLGLATIFGIVKQTGGAIQVDSKVGHGTIFTVHLPRISAADGQVEIKTDRISRAPSHETILLVEDDDDVRDLATTILATSGFTVLPAADGREALSLYHAQGGRVHLLITDVVMPGLSGRQLAEQLLLEHPHLKVLYTSGYTDDVVVQHKIQGQDAEFLQKPYSANLLRVTVRRVLDMN